MLSWFRQLDELLRGDRVRAESLATDASDFRSRVLLALVIVLGCVYGFFMGWYAVSVRGWSGLAHLGAATLKLPLLFVLTLFVTFPSLYVFNALIGCRLRWTATLRLLLSAVAVNLAVGASLGPILGFFTLSTKSYPFMVLLNVALLGIGGIVGLGYLQRTLGRLAETRANEEAAATPPLVSEMDVVPSVPTAQFERVRVESDVDRQERLEAIRRRTLAEHRERLLRRERGGLRIFGVWVVIYAIVGCQMGWVLRPFIGAPGAPVSMFREREGSFLTGFIGAARAIVGVGE